MKIWRDIGVTIFLFLILIIALISIISFAYQPTSQPTCQELEEQIKSGIEELNYCVSDNDCTIENFGCPFGCGSYVNKNTSSTSIKNKIKDYRERCGNCVQQCVPPGKPTCINGTCVEETEAKEVSIETDKTNYKQGEEVRINVTNRLNRTIQHMAKLEKKGDKWREIDQLWGYCPPCAMCVTPYQPSSLKANSSTSSSWDQKVFKECDWEEGKEIREQASPGTYRIKLTTLEKGNFTLFLSNEFSITE